MKTKQIGVQIPEERYDFFLDFFTKIQDKYSDQIEITILSDAELKVKSGDGFNLKYYGYALCGLAVLLAILIIQTILKL